MNFFTSEMAKIDAKRFRQGALTPRICLSWILPMAIVAIAPVRSSIMSHWVSQMSPCMPRDTGAVFLTAIANHHSMISLPAAIARLVAMARKKAQFCFNTMCLRDFGINVGFFASKRIRIRVHR